MIAIAAVPGVLGLLIGSFLNVVIYRVPLGRSVIAPASACPGCSMPIQARDNIPILSWLLLRGRCRNCKTGISWRYPAVEFGTGLLFLLAAGLTVPAILDASSIPLAVSAVLVCLAFLWLAAASVALALIDIDVHRLPDRIVVPSYLVGVLLLGAASLLSGDGERALRAGIAMIALAAAYFLMALVYPGGMGLGDVKLAGLIGLYLGFTGWGALAVGALAAFILAGLFAGVLIATGKATRKSGIPFGPWMLAGAWIGLAVGQPIAAGYLSLFGLTAA